MERLIKGTKEAIRSHISSSGDEWTKHDEESLESLAESLSSYVRQLTQLQLKNI